MGKVHVTSKDFDSNKYKSPLEPVIHVSMKAKDHFLLTKKSLILTLNLQINKREQALVIPSM